VVPRSPDELGASLNDAVNRHDANQVQDILCECFATLQEEAVNWDDKSDEYITPLKNAAVSKDLTIFKMLLWFPGTDVNFPQGRGVSLLRAICRYGFTEQLRFLLKKPGLQTDATGKKGWTALSVACDEGHLTVVKWLLASGKELALETKALDTVYRTPLEIAQAHHFLEIASLLEAYVASPASVTRRLREELDADEQDAADLFALVVFISDGLKKIKPRQQETPAARFFNVAAKLPLELQMVLCLRTCHSPRDFIQKKYSEEALILCGQRGVLEDGWWRAMCGE